MYNDNTNSAVIFQSLRFWFEKTIHKPRFFGVRWRKFSFFTDFDKITVADKSALFFLANSHYVLKQCSALSFAECQAKRLERANSWNKNKTTGLNDWA